jgi:hypothetical protein
MSDIFESKGLKCDIIVKFDTEESEFFFNEIYNEEEVE